MAYFIYENKKIFYSITGTGKPVLFLHGNTGSSKMFDPLLPLYQEQFQVIRMDFSGNGQSERVDAFPADLYGSQAVQTLALLKHLQLGRVSLVGCSGGAWTALNAALLGPELIDKVVADSFDGRSFGPDFAEQLLAERTQAKQDPFARQFYEWCQGDDWERVVDQDTKALLACATQKLPLFPKPLETLQAPVLLLGSLADTMCRSDLAEEYRQMSMLIPDCTVQLFQTGDHPAMATNSISAAACITDFIGK